MLYQASIAALFYGTEDDPAVLFMDVKLFTRIKPALFPDFSRKNDLALRAQCGSHGKTLSYLLALVNLIAKDGGFTSSKARMIALFPQAEFSCVRINSR